MNPPKPKVGEKAFTTFTTFTTKGKKTLRVLYLDGDDTLITLLWIRAIPKGMGRSSTIHCRIPVDSMENHTGLLTYVLKGLKEFHQLFLFFLILLENRETITQLAFRIGVLMRH